MFKKLVLGLFLSIFLVLSSGLLFGQSVNPEDLFSQGLILYRNDDLDKAKINFLKLAALEENNPRKTIGIFMLAKTHFQQNEFDNAIDYASELIDEYPTSSYLSHAYYLRASSFYEKKAYNDALDNFAYTIEFAQNQELLRLAESTATNLLDASISLKKIENLSQSYPWEQARPIITIWRAHLLYKSGQTDKAQQHLEKFIASKPEQRYTTIAQQLMAKDISGKQPQIRIGFVQPLSGYFAEEAQDFVRGAAFALKKRSTTDPEIALVVKDTRGDIVEAINSTLEIAQSDIELVISDLEGNRSATIAGLLKTDGIPVIIPISTDNNLTEIGEHVFQMNNDMETRGAALADYAINTLHMKTFATLSPADDYGSAITDAFTNKVDDLNGSIVSQQWYYPGTTDFSSPLQAIREAGFRFTYRDSLRAWGMDANMTRVDSIFSRLDRQSRRNSDDNEGLAEFTDISVRSIDGFFVPAYEEDIPYIASQFALNNIKSRLLGGDTWNNVELLRRHQRYINGVVYVAGSFISETDLDYITFTRDFRIATSTSPGITALYGYNVMNLVIDAVEAGNKTSQGISKYLSTVSGFQGLGTTISFKNHQRVNGFVNILQFQDGILYQMNKTD